MSLFVVRTCVHVNVLNNSCRDDPNSLRYNETMNTVLTNASNLDRPCRMLFPVVFSLLLSSIFHQARTEVSELLNEHMLKSI
eukprot:COSAG02_NODE_1400_length_12844_cov_5.256493_10_plen_82_part_00